MSNGWYRDGTMRILGSWAAWCTKDTGWYCTPSLGSSNWLIGWIMELAWELCITHHVRRDRYCHHITHVFIHHTNTGVLGHPSLYMVHRSFCLSLAWMSPINMSTDWCSLLFQHYRCFHVGSCYELAWCIIGSWIVPTAAVLLSHTRGPKIHHQGGQVKGPKIGLPTEFSLSKESSVDMSMLGLSTEIEPLSTMWVCSMGYRTEAGEICFTLAESLSTSLYDSFSQHVEYIVSSQSLPSPSEGKR